jgi:hypothetical protein
MNPEIILTDEQKDQVESLAKFLNHEQLADFLGICRKTWANILIRDETVASRYAKGKAHAIAQVAKSLISNALDGNVPAQVFYLRTQAGWKDTTVVEHTGTVKHEVGADEAFTALASLLGRAIPGPASDADPAADVVGDGTA